MFSSQDGLTLYFHSNRAGGSGDRDIMFASRPDTASPFSAPTWLAGVNGAALDQQATLTPDQLTIVFTSNRAGGSGSYDLWIAQRADPGDAFSTPANLTELNTSDTERGASLSADALTLYFTSDRPGGEGDDDTWFATRPDPASPFGAAQNLTVVNSPESDDGAELSPDGRELIWSSYRSGTRQLWRSYRDCL